MKQNVEEPKGNGQPAPVVPVEEKEGRDSSSGADGRDQSPTAALPAAAPPVCWVASTHTGPTTTLPEGFVSAVTTLEVTLKKPVLMILHARDQEFANIDNTLVRAVSQLCHSYPNSKDIAVLLHSPGGSAKAAYRIACMLSSHCNSYIAVVPKYAKSAATLLALGATDIIMSDHAELGPLDAQSYESEREGFISALDEVQSLERLHAFALEAIDRTMLLLLARTGKKIDTLLPLILKYGADMTRPLFEKIDTVHYTQMSRALKVAEEYAIRLLKGRYAAERASDIARQLVHGYPEHGFIIDCKEARSIGLLGVQEATPEQETIMDQMQTYLGEITAIGYLKELKCA